MTMPVPFLDLPGQHRRLRAEIDAAIDKVLTRADFVKGPAVGDFEESFAAYQDARECVAVGNGTDALEIALRALDLPAGSEVIVPANSFIATSEAVTSAGLRVVFADVDETYTLRPVDVEARITDQTSAVIAVHLYGQPADLAGLRSICDREGLRLVEDAAQAHGAEFNGRRVGALGDVGTFSFFPGKNLGAIGDAGAIVTNDTALASGCRKMANHGRVGKYDHDQEGRNSRMDTIQAAVLNIKLAYLDEWLAIRQRTADTYDRLLGPSAISADDPTTDALMWALPCRPGEVKLGRPVPSTRHAHHLYVVRVSGRARIQVALADSGIGSGVHYPTILPWLGAYRAHSQHDEAFACGPWSDELLSLPIGDHMDTGSAERVVGELLAAVGQQ